MDYVLDLDFAVFQMSAVTICTGILLAVILTIALFARRHEGITAPLALSVLGLLFGVLFSRFLHWYFNGEAYASFKAAFTGPAKKSHKVSERSRRLTAYHESGHAVAAKFMEHADPVHYIL